MCEVQMRIFTILVTNSVYPYCPLLCICMRQHKASWLGTTYVQLYMHAYHVIYVIPTANHSVIYDVRMMH